MVKASKMGGIALALEFEGLAVEDASRQVREMEVAMEKEWALIGKAHHRQKKN
ncbi:MAG TPA: hypothetical protein VGQ19_18385 [Burkholderiales bacterium]|jgi:hypothetical protein|nr:hypothetical protein [Burkholderiales bacterium]